MRETTEIFWDWIMTTTVREYKIANVKFNDGIGALLCNDCDKIIKHGFEHDDCVHRCKDCERLMESFL